MSSYYCFTNDKSWTKNCQMKFVPNITYGHLSWRWIDCELITFCSWPHSCPFIKVILYWLYWLIVALLRADWCSYCDRCIFILINWSWCFDVDHWVLWYVYGLMHNRVVTCYLCYVLSTISLRITKWNTWKKLLQDTFSVLNHPCREVYHNNFGFWMGRVIPLCHLTAWLQAVEYSRSVASCVYGM